MDKKFKAKKKIEGVGQVGNYIYGSKSQVLPLVEIVAFNWSEICV